MSKFSSNSKSSLSSTSKLNRENSNTIKADPILEEIEEFEEDNGNEEFEEHYELEEEFEEELEAFYLQHKDDVDDAWEAYFIAQELDSDISEEELDDNTPQTLGMKRYAAVAKKILVPKKYGQER